MKSRPRIAVVGASVRGGAFSLIRAGCEVIAADLFADADLKRVCPVTQIANYPEGLADWLAATPCDGWLYTGALENHPELVDRMAKLRPLLGNRGEVLRWVGDPLHLQEILGATRVGFPETKPCDGTHPGEGQWLYKTGQGGNGSGVGRAGPRGQAPRLAEGYWQREIKGTPGSAQYVAGFGSCSLLGVTRQLVGEDWTGAGEFQYCGTLAPWEMPPEVVAELSLAGRLLAHEFDLRGLFGIDFIFTGQQAWIIEINPRPTAAVEVVERVTGRNLLAEHVAAFGITLQNSQDERASIPAAGKAILYAKHPLAVSRRLSEQLLTVAGDIDRPRLADIPNPDTQISQGEPILTVFAEGNDLATVESELRDWVASLEGSLYRDGGGS